MDGTDILEEHQVPSRSKAKPVSKPVSVLRPGTRVAHEQQGWGTIVGYTWSEKGGKAYIVLFDKGIQYRRKERALVLDRASFKLLR